MFTAHSSSYLLLYFITIVLNLYLGLFVFFKNRKNKINQYFFFFILSVVNWIITLYLFYSINIPIVVLILGRINFVCGILIAYTFYKFVNVFPDIFNKNNKINFILLLETIFLVFITLFTSLIDKAEIIEGYNRVTIFGSLYFLFILHFASFTLGALIISIIKFRKSKGGQKLQIFYLFFGVLPALVGASITNITLPFFFQFYSLQQIAILFTIWMFGFIAYAIIKYRFLDIRVAVRRGFLKLILAAFAYGTFYGVSWIFIRSFGSIWKPSALITGIFIAIAFAILWPLIEKTAIKFSNKFLYASIYKIQDTLSNLAQDLTSIIDLDKITTLISKVIFKVMDVERVGILVKLPNQSKFQALQMIGFTRQKTSVLGGQASKKKLLLTSNGAINDYSHRHKYLNKLSLKCLVL